MLHEMIEKHSIREKIVHDKWIERKGLTIEVSPVSSDTKKNYDPFNIEVRTLDYSDSRVGSFGDKYDSKIILINSEFQPISISLEQQSNSGSEVDNHNEIYCFIMGAIVPRYSEISFKDFSTSFRIEEVQRKRPYSKVYKYLLVRD